jgi:hypothetical protein
MVAQARRLRTRPLTISDKDQHVLSGGDGLLYDALLTSTYYSPGVVGEISIHRWPGGVTNTLFVTSLGDGQSFTDPANNLQITQNSHNDSSVTFTVFVGLQPPTNLAATPGDSRVTLSWTANAGATGYNVKRATTSGGPYATVAPNVSGTTYQDTPLINGQTYYYVVSSVNGDRKPQLDASVGNARRHRSDRDGNGQRIRHGSTRRELLGQ